MFRARARQARLPGNPISEKGATTAEFLVVAGVVVAILLVTMAVFRDELATAITTIGCNIQSAVGGGGGGCGSTGPAAGSAQSSGGVSANVRQGGLLAGLATTASAGIPGGGGAPGAGAGTPTSRAGRSSSSPTGGRTGTLVRLPPPDAIFSESSPPKTKWGVSDMIYDLTWGQEDVKNATRYGNWYGPGWWGGSELDNRVGGLPPVDWLDACAQKHDMGYQVAEEYGKILGDAEKYRLMAIADEIAARDAARLPDDPRDWVPPPTNPEEARRYRDRLQVGFGQYYNNVNKVRSLPPESVWYPVPNYGPLDAAGLEQEQQRRVNAWNQNYLKTHPGVK